MVNKTKNKNAKILEQDNKIDKKRQKRKQKRQKTTKFIISLTSFTFWNACLFLFYFVFFHSIE